MVSEALDGLTDEQLADLELQQSGLVSGQNEGAIASTPFAQRMNPQPAPEPEPEAPVALSDYELNKLEEENYRRIDYVMTPQEFDQYWDRRDKEDNEVGRFFDGLGQGAAGLVGMVPNAANEISGALIRGVQDPIGQAKQNIQTGAEIIRKGGINLVQLFDWVSNKYDDLATGSKRAEAINAGIRSQLEADGRFTGDREQDEQIYQAALVKAREAGAYKPTMDQVREDRGKAYERYVREKSLERDFAAVSDFKTGESQMSAPTSAEDYQITDEKALPTVSTLGSMVVDPVNLIPMGAGALSKARVLRRIANLSEKPLLGAERVASGLADTAERIELGISTRLQDITGLTSKQQAALGAGMAGTAVYVDSATEGGGGLTKAVMMAGGILPTLHYGGALLRKVGSAAGGTATIVREAGVGGLGVARAEAASNLAGNAAVPERYRKFFTGYVDGTDSTLKRVAQNADNPEALRRVSRFADRMGATQVARIADDAVSGAVTAGIVGTPFAALQPDAERAGEVMGGILALGGAGGVVGGLARRAGTAADADIARMFADVQAVGGNVEAFARLPHATLDRLAAMQGVLAGKVDFVPLTGDEYRMNADIAQNGGEATAGVFLDRDANNRARVFINLDGKTAIDAIAPHEIGHAILTSNVLDGQPRNDLRNLVNQQYGPDGVETRGREYIARMVDADLRQGVTGEAPTVLTEAEMKAMDGGKTMEDIVADRAKDPAERDRLINERVEEFRQRSIDKGEDAMDWARDEIIAETFASEAPAIDFRAIRRDAMFPRLAESMLSAGGRVLEVFGANLSTTGKLMDNPSVLFRDNPLFQDRIMQKRVREYVRSYDQYLAGLEEAGAKEQRGVELARSSRPEDLARSTHVKLRNEGRGVLENDFLFQKPDGTYSTKPQKIITATENARSAQIKTLYDARKFVPVNSQEFGKRKVNGREVIGGPALPKQFDFFTNFPKYLRPDPTTGDIGLVRKMEASREEGGSWDIDVNVIGTGSSGRYRVINLGNTRAIQRETVPYGWIVSKANHLLAASLDLNAFRASAMKAINKGDLGLFNNDMRQVEADLKTYLANHRNGRPGEMTIGQQKRDMLNGLIGTGTAVQRTANPLYSDLNPRGSIRTWRVDRLNDAKPTGRTGYFFDYDKINNNRMPSALPQAGMAMPDAAPVRTLDTDRLLREYEENQGYLGLSTMGMREGRPVRGGAAETRRLLARNTEISRELDARGVKTEDAQLQRALAKRQTGQAMPDALPKSADEFLAKVADAKRSAPETYGQKPGGQGGFWPYVKAAVITKDGRVHEGISHAQVFSFDNNDNYVARDGTIYTDNDIDIDGFTVGGHFVPQKNLTLTPEGLIAGAKNFAKTGKQKWGATRGQAMPDTDQPRRYVSMEKFIEEAGDELGEVLPNAYSIIEFNDDDYPTHLVGFSDTRNSMYRSRVPSKQFFDWLHSDQVMDGLVFDKEYTPARPGEGAGHTRESYQAVIDRLREISLRPSKQPATGRTRGQAMPDVADIDSSTSVGALQKHPMFKSAKYDGSAKAAFDIVESLVKPKAIQDVMSKIDPSRPAYIIPVIAREGDSANMLPLAMAEKLSAATGIPIWAKLAKTSSQHNTGAGADSRARTAHRWEGEPPPAGSQIVLVDDTYTTGQTLRSLASVVGDPDAVATISVGRYTKQFTLQPDREQKLLAKAGLTKQQFINLYGSEPKQALTGAQAQQYLLNGARGEQGLLARFPVERGGFSTQAIAGLTQLPEGVTTFSGGGLVEIGLRGIVRPTVAVEYSPAIAQAYRAAHGDHVKVQDIRTVSLEDHKGKFHYHASPVCKNSSLLKSAALGGGEKDLDIESAQAVARHIDQIEPKVVTIENVPDYAKTEAADIIRKKLQERGYMMDENVYNAAKFGAPTARRRYLLRAVKDGVLPEPVPQDGPGWYSTVADLIETLPDDSIARAQYIYRSLREQGVDPNNVTEPLLVSGTTLFKKVAFARPDQPAFTFKATPATVDRILLPGGRVKRVTARAKARMTGIPDDYPLPKDEKTALTIIGNGVPPALVRNVFGPVIEANK